MTTWAEWEAAQRQPQQGKGGEVPVGTFPWELDWQRNSAAPVPPGFILVACMCGATLCRPATWRGKPVYRNGKQQEVRPAWTVGDPCGMCGAPYRRCETRTDPYVIDLLDSRERPGARAYWRKLGMELWAFGDTPGA